MNNLLRIFVLLFFVSFTSCQKEDDNLSQEQLKIEKSDEKFSVFEKNFPKSYKNLNSEYLQEISTITKSDNPDGFTLPVMDGQVVIGRYISLANEENAIYIDYSNYKTSITIYDVNDPNNFEIWNTKLNNATGKYEPIITEKGFWCGAACAVGTIAIAASDGPVPVMDVLAAAYAVACLADCAS